MAKFTKDPDSVLDYTWDWEIWLDGDVIIDVTFLADNGIIIEEELCSFTDTSTTVWLSGGEIGLTYEIISRITTFTGRITDRTIKIKIKEL